MLVRAADSGAGTLGITVPANEVVGDRACVRIKLGSERRGSTALACSAVMAGSHDLMMMSQPRLNPAPTASSAISLPEADAQLACACRARPAMLAKWSAAAQFSTICRRAGSDLAPASAGPDRLCSGRTDARLCGRAGTCSIGKATVGRTKRGSFGGDLIFGLRAQAVGSRGHLRILAGIFGRACKGAAGMIERTSGRLAPSRNRAAAARAAGAAERLLSGRHRGRFVEPAARCLLCLLCHAHLTFVCRMGRPQDAG